MNASAHLSWRHANSHRVWTVICTHMCTHKCTHMCTYIGMCEGWDAHTQQSHTHSRKSLCSVGSLQFFFFPSQFHACSLHKCFFYTCVLMVMSVLWEECSRAEAWMSPMFGSWWQLVALQCSVGSKGKTVHAAVNSSLVWADFLNSQVMSQVRREKKFHNCVISADSDDASVCLSWQQREGGCKCGVDGAQCSVHFSKIIWIICQLNLTWGWIASKHVLFYINYRVVSEVLEADCDVT